MNTIAVISAVGGAGATTVAAQLTAAFALQKRRTITFDFCSENILRLHFGMRFADQAGFACNLLAGKAWSEAAYRSGTGLNFVPFGQLRNDAELEFVVNWFRENPDWFGTQLAKLAMPADTLVICDTPRMPAMLREQVLSAAEIVLIVSAPDSISFATATRIVDKVARAGARAPLLLLNGFEAERQLDRDVSLLLRSQHKKVFSPVVIHRDESLREALACKQSVFDFAPLSQAAYDFSALATWIFSRLGQGAKAA